MDCNGCKWKAPDTCRACKVEQLEKASWKQEIINLLRNWDAGLGLDDKRVTERRVRKGKIGGESKK